MTTQHLPPIVRALLAGAVLAAGAACQNPVASGRPLSGLPMGETGASCGDIFVCDGGGSLSLGLGVQATPVH